MADDGCDGITHGNRIRIAWTCLRARMIESRSHVRYGNDRCGPNGRVMVAVPRVRLNAWLLNSLSISNARVRYDPKQPIPFLKGVHVTAPLPAKQKARRSGPLRSRILPRRIGQAWRERESTTRLRR